MPGNRQKRARSSRRRLSMQASSGNRTDIQGGPGGEGSQGSGNANGSGSGSGRDRSLSGTGTGTRTRTSAEERLQSSSSINLGPAQASDRLKQDPDRDERDPDGTSDDEPEVRLVILNAVQNFFDLLDTTERLALDTPGSDRGASRVQPRSPASTTTPSRTSPRNQINPEVFIDAKRRLLSLLRSKMLNMNDAQKSDLRAWVFHRYVMGHFDSITDRGQLRTLLERQMNVLNAIATETRPRTRHPAVPWFLEGYRAFLTGWQARVPEVLRMEERRRQEINEVVTQARREKPGRSSVSLLWRT